MKKSLWLACLLLVSVVVQASPPSTFPQAKQVSRSSVYADRNSSGDLYCGCNWQWVGRSGGVVDMVSCGYRIRAQPNRAQRIEWEHIVPASTLGRQRLCWQQGGRDNCNKTDPVFNVMEADLHNLSPVVGEVNADRSNFNVGMASTPSGQYGLCPFKVDFKFRTAEPPDSAKGMIARVHFYMYDRYGLNLSQQQERILIAWDRSFPPDAWERERDRRIHLIMGHGNDFVSGKRQWVPGFRPSRLGVLVPTLPVISSPVSNPASSVRVQPSTPEQPAVIGNRNSKIFHVRGVCPGYESTAPRNRISFQNEAQASAAGYRRAQNCR